MIVLKARAYSQGQTHPVQECTEVLVMKTRLVPMFLTVYWKTDT